MIIITLIISRHHKQILCDLMEQAKYRQGNVLINPQYHNPSDFKKLKISKHPTVLVDPYLISDCMKYKDVKNLSDRIILTGLIDYISPRNMPNSELAFNIHAAITRMCDLVRSPTQGAYVSLTGDYFETLDVFIKTFEIKENLTTQLDLGELLPEEN